MASWLKLLRAMRNDPRPVNDSYDDFARVVSRLGFTVAPNAGTSHRKWKRTLPDGSSLIVGAPDKGSGTLKPVYIKELMAVLERHGLFPDAEREESDVHE